MEISLKIQTSHVWSSDLVDLQVLFATLLLINFNIWWLSVRNIGSTDFRWWGCLDLISLTFAWRIQQFINFTAKWTNKLYSSIRFTLGRIILLCLFWINFVKGDKIFIVFFWTFTLLRDLVTSLEANLCFLSLTSKVVDSTFILPTSATIGSSIKIFAF